MKLNIFTPKISVSTMLNLLKVILVVIASRSSVWENVQAWSMPAIGQVISRVTTPIKNKVLYPIKNRVFYPISLYTPPVFRTVMAGAVIPFALGYGARRFEEHTDFRGRHGFHDDVRYDLLKMGHNAFHMINMSVLVLVIRKITKPLPDDIRLSAILSGIYFYAVGRQWLIDPAESRLMIALKYMPGICFGVVAVNRIPLLKNNIGLVTSVTSVAMAFHLMEFH